MKRIATALVTLVFIAALGPAQPAKHKTAHRPAQPAPAAAAGSVTVWVNTASGVYHYPGERWYGNTKQGKYISEPGGRAISFEGARVQDALKGLFSEE